MAVTVVLSEIQRAALAALCDTFAPALDAPDDPHGLYARRASDLGIPDAIEQTLAETAGEEQLAGVRGLLDALAAHDLAALPQEGREALVHGLMDADPGALAGLSTLRGLTHLLFYGLPDEAGRNPNWPAIGYPGPRSAPPSPQEAPKRIELTRPQGDLLELTAEAVVVGSGAGGGVVAGELTAAGREVVVLEAGGYYNEADFNQLELWAYRHLYRRGGVTQTASGSIALMAGANLGGGTTVNWTNMLRTPAWVREEWERDFGLEGLAGRDFDVHLDAVFARTSANLRCSDRNGPNERLREACEARGLGWQPIVRNSDPGAYSPETAGYMGFGDQSGAKQGTLRTYLQDAADRGARIVAGCRVERILVERGRAAGVEGVAVDEAGRPVARVVVRAPVVVCAAGALETPALLLRSGIGGPAAGAYLRLHPATVLGGFYDEPQRGWWGPPQSALSAQWADLEDGYGFLVETSHASPGLTGSALPWESGRQHKDDMARGAHLAAFVLLLRDRGHGRVTIDAAGEAVHHYDLTDELDVRHFRQGLAELARLHAAAGAREILSFHRRPLRWRRDSGEPLETYARRVHDGPLTPFEHPIFALHQMGSARMGTDPATSVADPWGQLHDTPGVWIGDAGAFPTATGTNPMATVMALARRTAAAIAAG
ncbi:MAG TPA: GMC family oxidoreductase N-terminal domain-containing protein [Capillimicrobium sp.]|nr:GMC family oxidoreductase N-terminal domain-containing protein [Capillimicrobium sp.]